MPSAGPMTRATRAAVRAIKAGAKLSATEEATAALAIELAKAMDAEPTAALGRELRATLKELPTVAKEVSAVDDLARRRAARRAGASSPESPAGDRVVGGPGGRRTSG